MYVSIISPVEEGDNMERVLVIRHKGNPKSNSSLKKLEENVGYPMCSLYVLGYGIRLPTAQAQRKTHLISLNLKYKIPVPYLTFSWFHPENEGETYVTPFTFCEN